MSYLYKKQTQSSLGATQTNSQVKTKGRTTPSSPYPAIYQVGSVFYHFSLRAAKVVQEFFDDCNTFIKERELTPTHCAVRSFIIRGGNNEGWAEIHTGTQSSAKLPSFPGEIDSGPRGALLSATSAEKVQRPVPISLSFSCPDTH